MYKLFASFAILTCLSGCSYFQIYRPVIEQGNILTSEKIHSLHTGMSTAQVTHIMGEPVMENIFSHNRLEYVYTYQVGHNPQILKKVICVFSRGRLIHIIQN